jgi:hypothetical protein
MKDSNVYVLLVSATPFAELGVNTNNKKSVLLTPGPSYYGVTQMIQKNRIIDYRNKKLTFLSATTPATIGQEMEKFLTLLSQKTGKDKGFVFIRENIKSKESKTWVANFKSYLDNLPKGANGLAKFTYFNLNQDSVSRHSKGAIDGVMQAYSGRVSVQVWKTCMARARARIPKALGIDAVLTTCPDRIVFIFVKEMLLAGKTLDTPFVRMVMDIPFKNLSVGKVDRSVQGLVGRCCGYGKDAHQVCIVSHLARVKAYMDWVNGGNAPEQPSYRSGRASKDGKKTEAKVSSAYVFEEEADDAEYDSDDEEPEDEDNQKEAVVPVKKQVTPVTKNPKPVDAVPAKKQVTPVTKNPKPVDAVPAKKQVTPVTKNPKPVDAVPAKKRVTPVTKNPKPVDAVPPKKPSNRSKRQHQRTRLRIKFPPMTVMRWILG